MKQGKRLSAAVAKRRAEAAARRESERQATLTRSRVPVNEALLRPTKSYGTPEFVLRGCYVAQAFTCKDCGAAGIWSPTQQKWWYEVAKGDVWTQAVRCRNCRRKERARKAEARRVHLEGRAKKSAQRPK